jgi:hypothetical protein
MQPSGRNPFEVSHEEHARQLKKEEMLDRYTYKASTVDGVGTVRGPGIKEDIKVSPLIMTAAIENSMTVEKLYIILIIALLSEDLSAHDSDIIWGFDAFKEALSTGPPVVALARKQVETVKVEPLYAILKGAQAWGLVAVWRQESLWWTSLRETAAVRTLQRGINTLLAATGRSSLVSGKAGLGDFLAHFPVPWKNEWPDLVRSGRISRLGRNPLDAFDFQFLSEQRLRHIVSRHSLEPQGEPSWREKIKNKLWQKKYGVFQTAVDVQEVCRALEHPAKTSACEWARRLEYHKAKCVGWITMCEKPGCVPKRFHPKDPTKEKIEPRGAKPWEVLFNTGRKIGELKDNAEEVYGDFKRLQGRNFFKFTSDGRADCALSRAVDTALKEVAQFLPKGTLDFLTAEDREGKTYYKIKQGLPSVLCSLPGCASQMFHGDSFRGWIVAIAIEGECSLDIYNKFTTLDRRYETKMPGHATTEYTTVRYSPGEILVFRADLIHRGSQNLTGQMGYRIHCYVTDLGYGGEEILLGHNWSRDKRFHRRHGYRDSTALSCWHRSEVRVPPVNPPRYKSMEHIVSGERVGPGYLLMDDLGNFSYLSNLERASRVPPEFMAAWKLGSEEKLYRNLGPGSPQNLAWRHPLAHLPIQAPVDGVSRPGVTCLRLLGCAHRNLERLSQGEPFQEHPFTYVNNRASLRCLPRYSFNKPDAVFPVGLWPRSILLFNLTHYTVIMDTILGLVLDPATGIPWNVAVPEVVKHFSLMNASTVYSVAEEVPAWAVLYWFALPPGQRMANETYYGTLPLRRTWPPLGVFPWVVGDRRVTTIRTRVAPIKKSLKEEQESRGDPSQGHVGFLHIGVDDKSQYFELLDDDWIVHSEVTAWSPTRCSELPWDHLLTFGTVWKMISEEKPKPKKKRRRRPRGKRKPRTTGGPKPLSS